MTCVPRTWKQLLLSVLLCVLGTQPARAHRLDELLQATILSVEPGRVEATVRLVPGVAVAAGVIAHLDTNHDGVFSIEEQQSYARQVLRDLQLQEDGRSLTLQLLAVSFASAEQMRAGTGEIQISFSAALPSRNGTHQLSFTNHHQPAISVYLVNSLVPQAAAMRLGPQVRNTNQSTYQVAFTIAGASGSNAEPHTLSGFGAAYRLGIRHIAEGTDHLLFLFTLLLPAPLLAVSGRWRNVATVRESLLHMLGIVTAFTLGHSLTLALACFGVVHVPSRPVELLIAVSILVSAVHAIRPLFPGREALVAITFGLIHGLAFASALDQLGVTGWYRLVSLVGFNLGIESMQLALVALVLPALGLLSRTRAYNSFRLAGALLALLAACAWIAERATDRPYLFAAAR